MRLRKKHPIDINIEYPCPCRRKGKLCNIILTEAMGCELCQCIFVLSPQGESIEQLNAHYPYKKAWYWTGKKWIVNDKPWYTKTLMVTISSFLCSLSIFILVQISLGGGLNLISVIIIGLIIMLLSAFWWLGNPR